MEPRCLYHKNVIWLVSTYVVCERLSVMHEPAGVVEILVQILQFTPILYNCQRLQIREFQNTPQNENCQRVQIREFQNTSPQIWKTSDFQLQNSLKIREIYVETNL